MTCLAIQIDQGSNYAYIRKFHKDVKLKQALFRRIKYIIFFSVLK